MENKNGIGMGLYLVGTVLVVVAISLACASYEGTRYHSGGVTKETETFTKETTEPSTAVAGTTPLTPDKLWIYLGPFSVARNLPAEEKPFLVFSALQEGDTFYHLWKKIIPLPVDSGVVKITADQYNDFGPCLFRDNKTAVFSSARLGNRLGMWKCNISGLGGITKVVGTDTSSDIEMDISPDGTKIIFVSYTTSDSPTGDYRSEEMMWLVNVDGSELTQLRPGRYPRWSPDGARIAFCYNGDIWLMNSNGGDVTKLTTKGGLMPSWSPDGQQICFASYQEGANKIKNWDIWKMNSDGSNLSQVIMNPGIDFAPVWGEKNEIYFISNRGYEKSGQYRIYKTVPK